MKISKLLALFLCLLIMAGCARPYTAVDDELPPLTIPADFLESTVPSEETEPEADAQPQISQPPFIDPDTIAEWDGEPCLIVDGNIPGFTQGDLTDDPYQFNSPLDGLGRCGFAVACIDRSLLCNGEREALASVTPSGWANREYDFIDGGYLYNRCHLLGFQLTGSQADERNLITGTRYMNVNGMLPYENKVADHVRKNDHHVLYRVTPRFRAEELVCRGVQMEAYCVECGNDEPFMFHVFCYNVQPGVVIDYETGENTLVELLFGTEKHHYVLNTSSKKFHDPACENAQSISEKNREEVYCTREELIYWQYAPCGVCRP